MTSTSVNPGTSTIKDREQLGSGDEALWRYWDMQEQVAEKVYSKWIKRAHRIIKRYRDERYETQNNLHRYNVLWSNVQTLKPALFSRTPKADVQRRFKDSDPIGRMASAILERGIDFTLEFSDLADGLDRVVDDRLLSGRGTLRAVYVPHYGDEIPQSEEELAQLERAPKDAGEDVRDDAEGQAAGDAASMGDAQPSPDRELVYEEVSLEYVYWEDYQEGPARTWKEVPWVRYQAYMTFSELEGRFGAKIAKKVTLDYTPKGAEAKQGDGQPPADALKKAIIHEIWDREKREVVWRAPGTPDLILDQVDDPLELPDFFPGPDPLFATTTNDNRVPVPDYTEYQDQARELDLLTARIDILTRALKVSGVYAAEQKQAIQNLLDEGTENKLIPIEDWASFATDKGGLDGMILWLPIKQIAEVLLGLYDAREKSKQILFEITGMADIIRGSSQPEETYGAQRIKNRFINLRLSRSQDDVQRFARDMVKIVGFIIATRFTPETISLISGFPQLLPMPELPQGAATFHDVQGNQQIMNAAMTQYIQANQPLLMENAKRRKEFDKAVELLKADARHGFRLDIETDSTKALDDDQEKNDRVQFLAELIPLMNQMVPLSMGKPQMAALAKELVLFGARGFKVARSLEDTIEAAFDAVAQEPALPNTKGNQKTPQEIASEERIAQGKQQVDLQESASNEKIQGEKLEAVRETNAARARDSQVRLGLDAIKLSLAERKARQQDSKIVGNSLRGLT